MPKFEQKYTSEEFLSALGKGFKTAGFVAKKCSCSRGTAVSYLCDLERQGLVHKISVDDGQSSVWEIEDRPEVVCADEKDFAQDLKTSTCASSKNLIVDPEFRDLIPSVMAGEYLGLESSIVENGYNPAFPIIVWKDQNIIIDGVQRFSICKKHNIPFEFVEQEFASRYDVVSWILENQLFRRNVNQITRLYLIGRRHLVERNEEGNPNGVGESRLTQEKISAQLKVGTGTVLRATDLTKAIDTIVFNTGCNRMDILSGDLKGTQDEIKELAAMDVDSQKRIVDLILNEGELSISLAASRLWDEKREKRLKEAEAEEKRTQKVKKL